MEKRALEGPIMDYRLIRSDRRTVSLSVNEEGLTVRAPKNMPKGDIDRFVESRREWILSAQKRVEGRARELEDVTPLTSEEIRALAEKALRVIPERVSYYAPLVGVSYGRITIRNQRTRWGSCSEKGNLNFNCLLMLTPPEAVDSVVVHELCHLKELNHSKSFYNEVLRVFPDYRRWEKWLKEHGASILGRMR